MALEIFEPSQPTRRSGSSQFEQLIANNPPILSSLIAQLPTQSILNLYHTSHFLQSFLQKSPTSWRYISWRLHQPATTNTNQNAPTNGQRQSSNYALDQLLMYVINPWSTRLASLELDNTAVSGAILFSRVMVLRKDTLEHVSVRGCKNVSLKYHINPWLTMHAMALDQPAETRPIELQKLALKSLYTYRCRHHRRRPYLPSSLARKESDSEPTHELVNICHKLGIWTDTAWCTTPGARCYRRRGYVTMRVPQDPREVWVVYDRLWRSRNWLGSSPDQQNHTSELQNRKRKRDGRVWEYEEEAANGEPIGAKAEGKETPAHLRRTHTRFVEDICCSNCSERILERCEQCSVMMHCSGCRKTLCASCAFDRPYLRNMNTTAEERNKFWWAPGCAVSPCSMQDTDPAAPGAPNQSNLPPNIKFKWCCTEPVFSGGGGITFGVGQNPDNDRIRAAPLKPGLGFEDTEFSHHDDEMSESTIGVPLYRSGLHGPGGRWASIADLFRHASQNNAAETPDSVPRILCDECHSSEQWKIKCKACSQALCLKHDVKERQRVRICGYKDLAAEKQELIARLKAAKLLTAVLEQKRKLKASRAMTQKGTESGVLSTMAESDAQIAHLEQALLRQHRWPVSDVIEAHSSHSPHTEAVSSQRTVRTEDTQSGDQEPVARPLSPSSNSTGPPSRASSPAPSGRSVTATPEPSSNNKNSARTRITPPVWRGCQSFFCPSSRPSGDHRRRCTASMSQCTDCKVHVCEDCISTLDKPCPCRGCRLSETEIDASAVQTAAFYCPNCRWLRMETRKCKRKPAAYASSVNKKGSKSAKAKNKEHRRKRKNKKPIEERASFRVRGAEVGLATPDLDVDIIAALSDTEMNSFFASMNLEDQVEGNAGTRLDGIATDLVEVGPDIRELQDMGMMARDLIRRIQVLRQQAGPGSPAALALPDIRVEVETAAALVGIREEPEESADNENGEGGSTAGNLSAPASNEL